MPIATVAPRRVLQPVHAGLIAGCANTERSTGPNSKEERFLAAGRFSRRAVANGGGKGVRVLREKRNSDVGPRAATRAGAERGSAGAERDSAEHPKKSGTSQISRGERDPRGPA